VADRYIEILLICGSSDWGIQIVAVLGELDLFEGVDVDGR